MSEDGGGIGQALFTGQAFAGQIKRFDLHFGHAAARLVGAGKMAEFYDVGHLGRLLQGGVGGGEIVREKAGAVHARIHFEPHVYRLLPIVRQQSFELPLAAHRRPQTVLVD